LNIGVNAEFAMPHWFGSDGTSYSRPVQHAKNTLEKKTSQNQAANTKTLSLFDAMVYRTTE